MKFKTLSGDINWISYGTKLVSPKLNNGDFDYWLVIDFVNMDEACGRDNEGQYRYHVSISAVSPAEAGQANLKSAADCCGLTDEQLEQAGDLGKVECLHSYGVYATLWQSGGDNAHKLMKQAKQEARLCERLFGFYMDPPKNKIGSTGWEFIKGDLDSGLARTIASGSVEGRILAKMDGITK